MCVIFTEILAVLSNKPEGSADWRTKMKTVTLKMQTPEGVVRNLVGVIKDPHQQHMYTTDNEAIMSAFHCPHCHHHHQHHHSHDVTEAESGSIMS